VVTLTPESPHHARADCQDCGRFLQWLPKPDAERIRRPAAHRELVRKYSRGFCELCGTREADLPPGQTLEAQHVEEYHEGGEPKRENIWIVCTACHKLIHWRRTWTVPERAYT
jgi:predicted restriction endonuclease